MATKQCTYSCGWVGSDGFWHEDAHCSTLREAEDWYVRTEAAIAADFQNETDPGILELDGVRTIEEACEAWILQALQS